MKFGKIQIKKTSGDKGRKAIQSTRFPRAFLRKDIAVQYVKD